MGKIKDRVGETQRTSNNEIMRIIKYRGAKDITVQFKSGAIVRATYSNFKKGQIKDPLYKSVFGIGFLGIGNHRARVNGKISKIYATWQNMLERCYATYFKNRYPTYAKATVCDAWQNYQVFAEWYIENHYTISSELMHLDKDIIKKGNTHYCPELCSFVPEKINGLLVKSNAARGAYPIGVSLCKPTQRDIAKLSIDSEDRQLGCFDTPIDAFHAYKQAKETHIKVVAKRFQSLLPKKIYTALCHYKVEMTD
jgi:hypothetical protein